jgi:hypothetical protein
MLFCEISLYISIKMIFITAQSKRKKLSIATCDKIYTESDEIENNNTLGMLKTNFKLIKVTPMANFHTFQV